MTHKQLAEFFVEQRVLEPSQAEDVLSEAELNGKTIAQAMMDGGFIDETGFYQTIANGLVTDFIDLTERDIAPEILHLIPSGLARLHGALPVEMSGTTLRVALVDPFDLHTAEDLRFALGKDIQVVVSPPEQIEELIKQHYGTDTTSMEEVLKQLGEAGELLQLRETDGDAAVEAEATLIDSGLPLLRSLNVLAKQERHKLVKKRIKKVGDCVQSGSTFSDALALHPRIFNDLYVNMVKAGEVGGVLELVLNRLSEFQEKAAKIKNKIAAAMVYP